MPLSVPSSGGGNGLAGLLRQGRPVKVDEPGPGASNEAPTTVSIRPAGRSGIDSTQRGTAHISAALTVYLSRLGGSDDPAPSKGATVATGAARDGGAGQTAPARSGAADLLTTLDAYRGHAAGLRLTA